MKKRYIFFIIFLLTVLIGISDNKSLASFYIQDFKINSEVLNNGDMKVEENITYYSTETKNGVTREIDTKNVNNSNNSADDVTLYNVKVDGENAKKVSSGSLGDDGVYEYSTSGSTYKIKVYAPFKGIKTRTITYEYLLENVGVKYKDTSEIYWNFIGNKWDCKISNLEINIKLPEEAANDTIYVYGHGSDNGSFTKNKNNITLYAKDLSTYQALDARILFSTKALSNTSKIVNKAVLEKYIDKEEGITNKKEDPKVILGIEPTKIAVVLIIALILFWIIIYFKYDKEIKVQKYHYYREIPHNLEPELIQRIYYGKECKDSFWIAFLNLVKMGVYKIEETTNQIGKKVNLIIYQEKENEKLKDYQISLINTINGFFDDNENSIDIKKLNAKMKRSSGKGYRKFINKLEEQKESYFGDSSKAAIKPFIISIIFMIAMIALIGIMITKTNSAMASIIITVLAITTIVYSEFSREVGENIFATIFMLMHFSVFAAAIIFMMIKSGIGIMYIPYILLFIIMQYAKKIKKLSKEENEIKEQIKGLRRYLKDYSKIEDKNLDSMIIWEDYLIIAIALKLNKKTINYFYEYCKNNLNNDFGNSLNSFGTYHYMNTMCQHTFSNYSSNSYRSSYSGSSGGFSGGSSSGGRRPVEVEEEAPSKNNKKPLELYQRLFIILIYKKLFYLFSKLHIHQKNHHQKEYN